MEFYNGINSVEYKFTSLDTCAIVIFINLLIVFHISNTEQIENSFESLGGKITS